MRPPFAVFPKLFAPGLVLRQVKPADLHLVHSITFYDGKPAGTISDTLQILKTIEDDYLRGNTIHWAICDSASDNLLGTVGFYRGFENNTTEVGYVMREDARGRGIMQASLECVTKFGFAKLGLTKIIAYTDPANLASVAVLGKCGFVQLPEKEGDLLVFELRDL